MTVYYFDFSDGAYATLDAEGHDMAGARAARQEVLKALVEVFVNEPRDMDHRRVACRVRDEHGTVVYRGSLTLEGVQFPND